MARADSARIAVYKSRWLLICSTVFSISDKALSLRICACKPQYLAHAKLFRSTSSTGCGLHPEASAVTAPCRLTSSLAKSPLW